MYEKNVVNMATKLHFGVRLLGRILQYANQEVMSVCEK